MCQLCEGDVSSFWPDVSTFRRNVSSFGGNVSTLAGEVSVEEGGTEGQVRSGWVRGRGGLGARWTPHRIPAGTPESAFPLGEGEEPWPERLSMARGGGCDGSDWGAGSRSGTPG